MNAVFLALLLAVTTAVALAQDRGSLTPVQLEIQKQQARLGGGDVEERRDAVARLGSMHHPDASRAALPALVDSSVIVRATAAAAILSLPSEESAPKLILLLNDRDEFVRREAAYALGRARSRTAVSMLMERLVSDKKAEVRGASAVALGQIADVAAVASLVAVLKPAPNVSKKKTMAEQDEFVLRSAARALGQIGNRDAVGPLTNVLQNEQVASDVRREAAWALGAIGDPSALATLNVAITSTDPHLSRVAHEAIQKIKRAQN